MYRAVLTYHPDVGTFRGTRGAWRVSRCHPVFTYSGPPLALAGTDYRSGTRSLFLDSPRRLHRGTFVNPTKLLRELFASRRGTTSPTSKE